MPKNTPAPNPIPDPFDDEPTIQAEPIPELKPKPTPLPPKRMWQGGTIQLTEQNREAWKAAHEALWHSEKAQYVLQATLSGDLLVAINDKAIAYFAATSPDSTVPRYLNNDFSPARDLMSDRSQDEFVYIGTLKRFDGTIAPVSEAHKRIAPDLWLVTVG